jgi:flagellar protein FliO/FliZ
MMNELLAVTVVLGLVAVLAWLARTGHLGQLSAKAAGVAVETAVSLGERRQLVIVAVEGRRLLLGVTAAQVTLVTELNPATAATEAIVSRSPALSLPDGVDEFPTEGPRA